MKTWANIVKVLTCCLISLSLMIPAPVSSGDRFVSIGTESIQSLDHNVGSFVAAMINSSRDKTNIRATVQTMSQSQDRLLSLASSGELQFAVASSKEMYNAVQGSGEWQKTGPKPTLRTVLTLPSANVLTLIASVDSKIGKVQDLIGKTIFIGNRGTLLRRTCLDMLEIYAIDCNQHIQTIEIEENKTQNYFHDGKVDALFFAIAHPNSIITELTAGHRKARLISIDKIDQILSIFPYYIEARIKTLSYGNLVNTEREVTSIGIPMELATDASVSDALVYQVAKTVFENTDKMKSIHPGFAAMDKAAMAQVAAAPMHSGALRFFKEAGLK